MFRCLIVLGSGFLSLAIGAVEAPDANLQGPYRIGEMDYRMKPTTDSSVLSDRVTEVWGRLFWPITKESRARPLIVFLHGNHGTCGYWYDAVWRADRSCEYTRTGVCPDGKVVVPNHRGYDYIARQLASWGFFVASINANRGINCGSTLTGDEGLNLARGRLILRHLQLLSEWNRGIKLPPRKMEVNLLGRFDFSRVGLMGHSRGGEGVRAAYHQYRDAGSLWPTRIPDRVEFQSILEIGGMDGQQSRLLNPEGVNWVQILPACDDDNSMLLGVRPFDRVMNAHNENPPRMKALFYVWGANHNYFSTEWHESDSLGCIGHQRLFDIDRPSTAGSWQQRQIAQSVALALFRGTLGSTDDQRFLRVFDPQFEIPASLRALTRIERTHLSSPNVSVNPLLDNYQEWDSSNPHAWENIYSFLTMFVGHIPDYYSELEAGRITWTAPGSTVFFQNTWAASGEGVDLSADGFLSFRISRQRASFPAASGADFGLQLVDAKGNESNQLRFQDYGEILEPVGTYGWPHPILNTMLIPLADFMGVERAQIRGLKLIFDATAYGTINLDEMRIVANQAESMPRRKSELRSETTRWVTRAHEEYPQQKIYQARRLSPSPSALQGASEFQLIEFQSDVPFRIGGSLLELVADGEVYRMSEAPSDGQMTKISFKIPRDQMEAVLGAQSTYIRFGHRFRWNVEESHSPLKR